MSGSLVDTVRRVLDQAEPLLPPDAAARIPGLRDRLDGPMRVALAGRIKAGKSTLLNALIGVRLAPTEAGECTKVVSWYRHGQAPSIGLVPMSGRREVLGRWSRTDGELDIPLDDRDLDEVSHLDIRWPTKQLQDLVLIDTPGLASVNEEISARSTAFMLGEGDVPGEADAVVYLLRNTHPTDLSFLEAFRGTSNDGTAINAIGIVSRADEVGGAGLHAMDVARRAAERFAAVPDLRQRCQTVIPIAGLLAQGAMQYSETDHQALRAVARESPTTRRRLLLSATRFTNDPGFVVPPVVRYRLIREIGLFGVRYAVELLAERDRTSQEISTALRQISGLGELDRLLKSQFAARAQVLKCRSVLHVVEALAKASDSDDAARVRDLVRDVEIGTHEFEELAALQRLRRGEVDGSLVDLAAAERVLGGLGTEPWTRLDLPVDTDPGDALQKAAIEAATWRSRAEHPLFARPERELCNAARRSAEGLVASLAAEAGSR